MSETVMADLPQIYLFKRTRLGLNIAGDYFSVIDASNMLHSARDFLEMMNVLIKLSKLSEVL